MLDWPDGSTLRDPDSLVPEPAGTWVVLVSARWGGQHTGGRAGHKKDISTQQRHWDAHRAQRPAGPAGYFSMVVAPETQQKQESPEFCFPPPGILPITCGQGPGDSEPRRLVGLANIIGNLTNILPALRLCHIIQGQHLRIRAINPRVLEQTNNMESHGCAQQRQRPDGQQRLCRGRGCSPHTHSRAGGTGLHTGGHGRKEQAGMGV